MLHQCKDNNIVESQQKRRCDNATKASLAVLGDLVVLHERDRSPSSTCTFAGRAVCNGARLTAHLLGATRVDGGVLLVTERTKGRPNEHRVYLLDDLQRELNTICCHCYPRETSVEFKSLVEKAIIKREKLLAHTTNYFSDGKVYKIL